MSGQPWSDDDLALLSDRADLTAAAIADLLGRSTSSVHLKRRAVRQGCAREKFAWGSEEDDIIRSAGGLLTASKLSESLPGRSEDAIRRRQRQLGINPTHWLKLSPHAPGTRPVIAKTCPSCGVLLPAHRFQLNAELGHLASFCRFCGSDYKREHRKNKPETYAVEKKRSRAWHEVMQKVTSISASRQGLEYTERDCKVLADHSLTNFAKAIQLGRTYYSVTNACSRMGFTSAAGKLGARCIWKWSIDNPNADRIEEITASLKQEFESAGVKFPEWDWDDADLKESA